MRRPEQRSERVSAVPNAVSTGWAFTSCTCGSKYQPERAPGIIITHGWPGSVVEFLKVIGPLTDPTAHGGKAEDAFHVVVPSLPGFGFSDKPAERGWGLPRIAKAWATLMKRLGYGSYVAQGGDWGAGVATWMAKQHVEGLKAVHLNLPILFPPPIEGEPWSGRKARPVTAHRVREHRLGVRQTPEHPPGDAGPRPRRHAGRPGRLDLREAGHVGRSWADAPGLCPTTRCSIISPSTG